MLCEFDGETGGSWEHELYPCEPIKCVALGPLSETDEVANYMHATETNHLWSNNSYYCPKNQSLPAYIEANFTFGVPAGYNYTQEIHASCEYDKYD